MIIRSKVRENYTCVSNVWIRDVELSAKAKGIFAYLLTLPNDWDLHIGELTTHFVGGIDGIRNGIRELIEKGYVLSKQRRDEKTNMIVGWDYTIVENPYRENPHMENPTLLSTKEKLSTNNKSLVDLVAKYKLPILVLNKLTGRNFRLDNRTVLSNIKARVKDGSPIEEIIEVIKFICKKRMGTEFEMFLRPSTVFNKTKYENYLEEYKYLTKDGKYAILNTGTFLNKAQTLRDLS